MTNNTLKPDIAFKVNSNPHKLPQICCKCGDTRSVKYLDSNGNPSCNTCALKLIGGERGR